MSTHRPTPELPAHLEALYARFPFERSLAQDPLSGVRAVATDPWHAEVAGIVAATIAVGNTTSIRRAFADLLARSGGDLTRAVDAARWPNDAGTFGGFRHRWIRGAHIDYLCWRLREVRQVHGSLETVFARGSEGAAGFAGGLNALSQVLRGPDPPAGYARLFPTPLEAGHSACKRLTLFVRWMVRAAPPDLGVWHRVDPADLRVPLDQHVFWIAYNLGLTARRTRNWATVEEVTSALRAIDPADPVRFDFVLCHTGISGDCPKRRDLAVCGPCSVRLDCRLWRGRGRAG